MIVCKRSVAQSVGQSKAVIGFGDGCGRSLQPLVYPIEFVDQNELLGRLHQFCSSRLPRTARTGGSKAVRNPPFCRILSFVLSDVFFLDRALRSCRLRRSRVILGSVSGTLPFITFLAHSLTQSRNFFSHLRTYSLFALSPILRMHFNTGRYFFVSSLVLLAHRRTESLQGICLSAAGAPRPVQVGGRRANNCRALASRPYMLPRQRRTCWDTSGVPSWQTG